MLGLFLFMMALGLDVVSPTGVIPIVREGTVTLPAATQLAEPQEDSGKLTTAVEVQPILNATRVNRITVRECNGQGLVYVTHLWSWRCGLVELRIGLNGAPRNLAAA